MKNIGQKTNPLKQSTTWVMISSTVLDLPIHRAMVGNAVIGCRMLPRMMETLGASPDDAIDASLKLVNEANIYIGIFGNRYGYIPDSPKNPSKLSVTELEYRRAFARKIPILIYLMSDSHAASNTSDETLRSISLSLDDDKKLRSLKEELKTKHVVAFFNSPEELAKQVTQSLLTPVSTAQSQKYTNLQLFAILSGLGLLVLAILFLSLLGISSRLEEDQHAQTATSAILTSSQNTQIAQIQIQQTEQTATAWVKEETATAQMVGTQTANAIGTANMGFFVETSTAQAATDLANQKAATATFNINASSTAFIMTVTQDAKAGFEVVTQSLNVREGPGTDYPIYSTLPQGFIANDIITGRNSDCSWLQIKLSEDYVWVRNDPLLVKWQGNCNLLDIKSVPTLAPVPTATPDVGSGTTNIDAQDAYDLGQRAYNDKQYQTALKYLDNSISLDRNYYDAYILRGETFVALKSDENAIVDFTKAISLQPNNPIAYIHRAEVYRKRAQYQNAIADISLAIQYDPTNKNYYSRRAQYYQYDLGDLDKALADYKTIYNLDPSQSGVAGSIGQLSDDRGYYCDAIKYRTIYLQGGGRDGDGTIQKRLDLLKEQNPNCPA
ncbi:MAG: DUF4062 domain-containing protein [Anaerolineaceae bacterium]|nr:DUF4062 domain-containing protein [Anaerolineaceae bacterium]